MLIKKPFEELPPPSETVASKQFWSKHKNIVLQKILRLNS